jgi:hypothetical protein
MAQGLLNSLDMGFRQGMTFPGENGDPSEKPAGERFSDGTTHQLALGSGGEDAIRIQKARCRRTGKGIRENKKDSYRR